MRRYFFVADTPPRIKAWSPSRLRGTVPQPVPRRKMFGIVGATETETEKFHDIWYVVESHYAIRTPADFP
jgi:hypothetical protein